MFFFIRFRILCKTNSFTLANPPLPSQGWSGGAMVLGKLSMPGRPTYLDNSMVRAYCACSRCGWVLFGHFSLVYHFSFLTPFFWEMARYRLKYCLKGPKTTNQPTNQPYLHPFQKKKKKKSRLGFFWEKKHLP